MKSNTQAYWDRLKTKLKDLNILPYEDVYSFLTLDNNYLNYLGKAKNRTLISENLEMYKSIMFYTQHLEDSFKLQNSYAGFWNFSHRLRFIVEHNTEITRLKCKCGKKLTWTTYCRHCPDYKRNQLGKPHTELTKRKMRLSTLDYIKTLKGQVVPRYNKTSITVLENYAKKHNLRLMHAENGGEFFIKELGYFVDGYDPINNVVVEFDERHHFTLDGKLKQRDVERETEIKKLLKCEFIRIRYDQIQE